MKWEGHGQPLGSTRVVWRKGTGQWSDLQAALAWQMLFKKSLLAHFSALSKVSITILNTFYNCFSIKYLHGFFSSTLTEKEITAD